METEQVNVAILIVVYLFVVGGLVWRMTKPKALHGRKRNNKKRGN